MRRFSSRFWPAWWQTPASLRTGVSNAGKLTVEATYDQTKERIREQAYWRDQRMKKVAKKSQT